MNATVVNETYDNEGTIASIHVGTFLEGEEYREAVKDCAVETTVKAIRLDSNPEEIILFYWEDGNHWTSSWDDSDRSCYFHYGLPEDSPPVQYLVRTRKCLLPN